MEINILLTSVSRKILLLKAFKGALKLSGFNGKIITADVNPLSAGMFLADKGYKVPESDDPSFIKKIFDICKKEKISLIIPTRNDELSVFSENKKIFEKNGIKVMVSDIKVINTCLDKYKFYKFLVKNNIPAPETLLPSNIDMIKKYPLIIKERFGSGSKAVFKINNKKDLDFFSGYIKNPIIQEFLDGVEYTVDLFSDFDSKIISIVPRERIEIVDGEAYKSKTVKDWDIINSSKRLAEKLGTIGHITIQCIKGKTGVKFIEVNPRFGGACALSIASGVNTPLFLLYLMAGKKINKKLTKFKEGLMMLRYTDDIYIDLKNKKML